MYFKKLSQVLFTRNYRTCRTRIPIDLPKSVDWRKQGAVTPVRDQGECGCCWAIAATGAVESLIKIKTGKLVQLSPQELVEYDTSCSGCHGGGFERGLDYIKLYGVSKEDDYPFFASGCPCPPIKKQRSCRWPFAPPLKYGCKKFWIDGIGMINSYRDENNLLRALSKQPVCVTIDATELDFYDGGIWRYRGPSPITLNHDMLAVGYGSEKGEDYVILKNSWGSEWGENGYMRVKIHTGYRSGLLGLNLWTGIPIIKRLPEFDLEETQRPGEPCYMETGVDKFGENCKFHHPTDCSAPATSTAKSVQQNVKFTLAGLPRRELGLYWTRSEHFLMPGSNKASMETRPSKPTTNNLIQVLEDVQLGYILSCFDLDSTHEWPSVLSLGEQQRLAFARLLLSKPNLILLDESTSALDEADEAHLCKLIQLAGITYISIGHQRTLYGYHEKVLHISTADPTSASSNWTVEPITKRLHS